MTIYAVISPLIGALLLFLKNEPNARFVPWTIGVTSMLASCFFLFSSFPTEQSSSQIISLFSFLHTPSLSLDIKVKVDFISYALLGIICIISLFITIFCLPYSKTKPNTDNLLAKLLMAIFALMLLSLANSPILLFLAFILTSLFSYVSSNFYLQRYRTNQASLTALAMNISADFMILAGIISTLIYKEETTPAIIGWLVLISILIKGGQIPFGLWVSETMETPSPVAAFVNSLVIPVSSFTLFQIFAPLLTTHGLIPWLCIIAIISALASSIVALVQFEIKKIISYSTIAITALVLLALANDNTSLALMILALHAIAKALLFLTYASVIQASSGEHDIRAIGGLGKVLKFSCFNAIIGSGVIILLADIFIFNTFSPAYTFIGTIISALITLSLSRLVAYTFFGKIFGIDAIIARLKPESKQAVLSLIGLSVIAIVTTFIFISDIGIKISWFFVVGTLFAIAYITISFSRNFSLRELFENKYPKLYFFIYSGFGASAFYQAFLPSFTKDAGNFLLNEASKLSGSITAATSLFSSPAKDEEKPDTSPEYSFKKHLAVMAIGIFLFLLFSFLLKEI